MGTEHGGTLLVQSRIHTSHTADVGLIDSSLQQTQIADEGRGRILSSGTPTLYSGLQWASVTAYTAVKSAFQTQSQGDLQAMDTQHMGGGLDIHCEGQG